MREQIRAPLMLVLLVAIPAFFVLIFASVLGEFALALGGTLASQSATAISAGWAAAFLSGTLAFFQVSSSRGADRRLASAGLGATRVAVSRIAAALVLGVAVSAVAFVTLWLRSGIGRPFTRRWAALFPGYGPSRIMVDGAFSHSFHTTSALLLALAWAAILAISVYLVLRRAVGVRARERTKSIARVRCSGNLPDGDTGNRGLRAMPSDLASRS